MREYKLTLFLAVVVVMVTEIRAAGPAAAPAKGKPPEIVDFPKGDLDKISDDFTISCKATGTKPLTWTWKKDGVAFPWSTGSLVEVKRDGTLSAEYINMFDDGVYQCFVKNAFGETYSRKIKVKVTVIGRFLESEDSDPLDVEVTIGRSKIVPCPKRRYSYGQFYSWGTKDLSTSRRLSLHETKHRFVTQNGTLVFAWVNTSDVTFVNGYGGVSCAIEGGSSIRRSRKIRFKVVGKEFKGYTPPTFYSKPDEVIHGTQGKMVNVYCAALGKPAPSIVWFKDNNIVVSGENGITLRYNNRNFQINDPGRKNHGNYKCQATNTNPKNGIITTIVHYWQLVIRSSPLWKVKPSNQEHIAISSNLTLMCEAEGYPKPDYTWRKEGKVVSSSAHVKVNGGKLEIIRGREQDGGVYHCDAENQVGHLVSSTWLQISAESPTITNFPQYNLDYPTAVVARHIDRGFKLPCIAVGTKPLKWTWKVGRRGKKLDIDGKKFVLEANGTLIGRNLTEKDSNFYQCEVSNKQGTVFSRRIRIKVSATGKFYQNPNETIIKNVSVGQPLVVHCPLHSHNFGCEILWEGVSAGKARTLRRYVVEEGSGNANLVFSYLSRNDLNEAKRNGGLQCVLKSGNIKEKSPKIVLNEVGNEFTGDAKPSFVFLNSMSTSIKAIGGSEKTIPCYVTGKPDVTIEWEFNSNKIVDGTNSFSMSFFPAHLVITNVEKSKHEGSYKCTATNSVGTVTSPTISLQVFAPPKLAIKPKTLVAIYVGESARLQCKVDSGGPRPKWFRNGKLAQESARLKLSGGNLTLSNAAIEDSAVYQCVAESRIGMVVTATVLYVDKSQP